MEGHRDDTGSLPRDLSSFGTFWAVEGLGVAWPGTDGVILALVGWYVLAAAVYIGLLRRPAGRLVPQNAR